MVVIDVIAQTDEEQQKERYQHPPIHGPPSASMTRRRYDGSDFSRQTRVLSPQGQPVLAQPQRARDKEQYPGEQTEVSEAHGVGQVGEYEGIQEGAEEGCEEEGEQQQGDRLEQKQRCPNYGQCHCDRGGYREAPHVNHEAHHGDDEGAERRDDGEHVAIMRSETLIRHAQVLKLKIHSTYGECLNEWLEFETDSNTNIPR